jgi:hypothetical protein
MYDMEQVKSAYNELTALAKIDLQIEWKENRIKGTEYADAFKAIINTCLQLAIDVPLKDKQVESIDKDIELKDKDACLKDKQCELADKDLEVKDKQIESITKDMEVKDKDMEVKDEQKLLYQRQREGFDDDLRRKMLDIQMNTWGIMFSSGLLTEKPSIITDDEVSDLYLYMKDMVMP